MRLPLKLAIDHYIGGSLAWMLNIFAQLFSRVFTRDHSLSQPPRAVLFLKFIGLGSIVRSAFLLPAARERFPGARVYFATFRGCADLVRMYPEVDETWVVRDHSLLLLALDTVKLLAKCWWYRVDLVVDLEVHSKYSSIVSALSFARDRAGFAGITSRFRRGLYTHLVFWNPVRSIGHAYRQLGRAIGLESPELYHAPLIPEQAEVEADSYLRSIGIGDDTIVLGVNPNASELRNERRWPLEAFARLISELPADPRLHVLLVGSPSERQYVEQLRLRCRGVLPVHNAAGAVRFAAFGAMLKRCTAFLTNDSGPLHLAAVLRVPTISLWGPTHPSVYGPRGGVRHVSIYRPIYCSPCTHASDVPPCDGDNQCMKRIDGNRVLRTVCRELGVAVPDVADLPAQPSGDGNMIFGYWRRSEVPLPILDTDDIDGEEAYDAAYPLAAGGEGTP